MPQTLVHWRKQRWLRLYGQTREGRAFLPRFGAGRGGRKKTLLLLGRAHAAPTDDDDGGLAAAGTDLCSGVDLTLSEGGHPNCGKQLLLDVCVFPVLLCPPFL